MWFKYQKYYHEITVKKWSLSALIKCYLEDNKCLNELIIKVKPKKNGFFN